jgi:hypothetical protein
MKIRTLNTNVNRLRGIFRTNECELFNTTIDKYELKIPDFFTFDFKLA